MDSEFQVKTHIFEGPLETLLSLIEKRKLFINDISLAQVADDYISYVKTLENSKDSKQNFVSDLAHFILVASTLVLIKSKSLLPTLTLTEEEQGSIDDLENRLREYQKYKELSRHIRERFGKNIEYERLPSKDQRVVFTPDKNTSVAKIFEIAKAVIFSIPKKEFVPKAIVEKVVSLEEMIESLTNRVTKAMRMTFKEFAKSHSSESHRENKINIIVSFLAMLELVKQGIIQVKQDKDFHEIEIENQSVGVPRY